MVTKVTNPEAHSSVWVFSYKLNLRRRLVPSYAALLNDCFVIAKVGPVLCELCCSAGQRARVTHIQFCEPKFLPLKSRSYTIKLA